MSSSEPFPPELARELDRLGPVDIVVGIPSYNNAGTIGHVVRAASAGLAKHYPDRRCLIVNSDGGSTDGTPMVVLREDVGDLPPLLVQHRAEPIHRVATGYLGVPGKGSALRTILRVAERTGAKACAVLDSDLRSVTPQWVELLIEPVLGHGMDFVAPLYTRHKYDGTITNSIVYPVTRALYGKRVRQPIGGEFGFSGALASHWLGAGAWDADVSRYGIDVWLTTRAIVDGFAVCQSYLGAKIHDAKDPGADLTTMFTQVVGTVFELMRTSREVWERVRGSETVPTFGFRYAVAAEPIAVNVERLIAVFRQAVREVMPLWRRVLDADTCAVLEALDAAEAPAFRFPAETWVRVVYACAAGYQRRTIARDHLLKAMIPLYLGRTAAFVIETASSGTEEVEATVESLCGVFESLKPYLLERWEDRRS